MDRLRSEEMTMPRRLGQVAMPAVLLANSSVAFAAPPKPAPKPPSAASRSYDEAQRQLAAGNHEAALALYAKLSNVESRRGAALALDKLGRTDEAIAEHQKFSAAAPPALQEQANTARARVAELSAARTVKVRVVTTPPGAAIEIAGQPPSGKISPADVDLPPGKHIVRATLAGSNAASREIEVGSSPQEVSLELTPIGTRLVLAIPASVSTAGAVNGPAMSPTPRAEPRPEPGIECLGAPIVTGAAGALALGAGVIFGISALGKQSDYTSDPSEKRAAAGTTPRRSRRSRSPPASSSARPRWSCCSRCRPPRYRPRSARRAGYGATACACASEPSSAPRYSAAASTVASSSPSACMPGAMSSPFASSSRSGRSLMMPTRFSTFMTW